MHACIRGESGDKLEIVPIPSQDAKKREEVKEYRVKNVCVCASDLCVWQKAPPSLVLKAGTVAERWAQLAFLSVIAPRHKC